MSRTSLLPSATRPGLLAALALPCAAAAGEEAVSFARDIRPILSDRCFQCHGFDEQTREAGLGLHDFTFATADLGGYQAVVPGDPGASALLDRVLAEDPADQMPPPSSNKPRLSTEEADLFRRWIAQGARYETHWAFAFPEKPAPRAEGHPWIRNEIDAFVLERLEKAGLEPAPEASPWELVRRVHLDLIGLPPSPEDAAAFAAAHAADPEAAWRELVARLLASPRYGERWARQWMDLARYADTNGYEKDRPRSIWPWRDWVIRALDEDMPYDRFTIEQLAGDMLPGATLEQRVATGFHRNTMLNEEGGIDPLEYRFHAMTDRVAVTGTVWLGLTTGCAQCHTHKFDPITHADYFGMMALLNNADEPALSVPDPAIAARRAEMQREIAAAEAALAEQADPAAFAAWLEAERSRAAEWIPLEPVALASNLPRLAHEGEGVVFASGDFTKRDVYTLAYDLSGLEGPVTSLRLEALPDERLPAGGPGAAYYEGRSGDFFLSEFTARAEGRALAFSGASHDFGKIYIGSGSAAAELVYDGDGSTGWSTATAEGRPHELVLNLAEPLPARGRLEVELLFERHFVAALGKFRVSATTAPHPAAARALPPVDPLSSPEPELRLAYARTAPDMAEARKPLEALERRLPEHPVTLVLQERLPDHPRPTHRHHRGEWIHPEEEVAPAVPAVFPGLPEGAPANRLGFARWLVDPGRNPLAARVAVNRAWRAFFGEGLVKTAGDFGYQSELPSHPRLLDWLAAEFVERGWSMKALHRLIVSSATYRQSSRITPEALAMDPGNALLARGPRHRLDGEVIRDAALAASGLLSPKMGGPGVHPPQPGSVTADAYGAPAWTPSAGEDRWRRSVYTFAKRTAPFAAYLTFDGPAGEACLAQRERSNTPLQALTLLNDEMYLEAAAALARNAWEDPAAERDDPEALAAALFRRVLVRSPDRSELADLTAYHQAQRERLAAGELDAVKIAGREDAGPDLAAWTLVARALLNLDEAVTK